ncbi:hypothetical protein ABZ816_34535 [Actinosynnema sp. NPDC047251]|uniref:Putative secreted protein n=1 Tax=Saccharothrix espanaensis (strain ATCC 51144 / DSM 44229 / JCM 9112 / NBRC 15066 / NRRL 15764) TaxID=1179773 RepID=K0K1H6_SACES|nr:hypothetical protein [Saccharothrix espanaensis]CCH32181.1 putative secreted protein [Saccharothrix espanaensis DSM 44229]
MRKTVKVAAVLTTAAATTALLAGTATAQGSAAAPPWLSDPATCSNPATAVQRTVNTRVVQVRNGNCGGVQYGWGRILNYTGSEFIRFEVDLNGDRVADDFSTYTAGSRNYTQAYPTSSSPNRAFRACYVVDPNGTCTPDNATAWW